MLRRGAVRRVVIRWVSAAFLLLLGWTLDLAAAHAAAAPMFTDAATGLRFPVPFPEARFKTANQVRELLLRRQGVRIPPAAQFTCGIYSDTTSGMPYLLAWKLTPPADADPVQWARMAAVGALDGIAGADEHFVVQDWSFRADVQQGLGRAELGRAVQARFLVQVLKDSVVYLGYFYKEASDAAGFDAVINGLVIDQAKARLADPPPRLAGVLLPPLIAAVAFAVTAASLLYYRFRRRIAAASAAAAASELEV